MDVDFIKKLNDLAKNLKQHDMNMSSNEAINKASKMLRNNDSFNEMKENNASSFNEKVSKRFNISSKVENDEDNIKELNSRIANDKSKLNNFFSKVDYELKKLEPRKNIINYLLFSDLKRINPNINTKQDNPQMQVKKEIESSIPKIPQSNNQTDSQRTQEQTNQTQPQNVNAQNKSGKSVDLFNFFNKGEVSSNTNAQPKSPQQQTNQNNQTQKTPQKNNNSQKSKVDLFDFFNNK